MQATVQPISYGGLTVPPTSGKTITIQGGYDAEFTPNPDVSSFTTVHGKVTLQNGTLRVQRVKVR
jgi:hypothetical protein